MKNKVEITKLNVNGNRIAVFIVNNEDFDTIEQNFVLREILVNEYKNIIDTIMITTQISTDLVKTIVFEPNSGNALGNFSNMCGNGLRAISQVTKSKNISTPAGLFTFEEFGSMKYICTQKCINLKNIDGVKVANKKLNSVKDMFNDLINFQIEDIQLLANCGEGSVNGEPHLTVLLQESLAIESLIMLGRFFGFGLSSFFGSQVQTNVTFASLQLNGEINTCTFERNLGSDPQFAITGSCGTGAMAAANIVSRRNKKEGEFIVNYPSDVQKILIKDGKTFIFTTNNYENI